MATAHFPGTTPLGKTSNKNQSLLRRILKFKVFIICLSLLLVGILFLVVASILTEHGLELPGHLLRDIGIVFVTTGLVVFAADYMTRKDFIALLATELEPLREEVGSFRDSMVSEMAPLRTDMSSLMSNLVKEITPLKQEIPTLSIALDNIRKCISLGATMSVLGIKQIHDDRLHTDLRSKLEEAGERSEIKILGIIAAGISDLAMEEPIQQKLKEGCRFKILCLNPASRFVEERAAEENRDPVEMRADILSKIQGWKDFVEHHVPEDRQSQVELKCHDSTTRYFLFITATLVVVGFYLGRSRGTTSTHLELEIKQGGMATAFIEHFDSLWKGAKGPPMT